ncbi:Rieske 2Fe-2S domain-containing protein [Massilia alkalitolerans]|uniref:Rieske 2Fe-2S domain-containing protein n=1 Tax=Massilia alkalitolerans TaxID=286638 RepID=UPI0028ABA5A6|nr:Rieske 2Fe-2S domain-containing protein [Massilia alkalitolerans]
MTTGQWWIVALSEQLAPGKTLAAVCDGRQLALFRNNEGEAFALEDRCPHRRVPLSPGLVKPGGLQCPYHGWTFDGASGKCTDIPNLRREEKIPPAVAQAYPVAELNGFVHVFLGDAARGGEPDAALPAAAYRAAGREYSGTAVASIAFEEYLDVMLDGPECLLAFPGVVITDFFLGDPRRDGRHLVLDRGAVWKGKGIGPAFVRDHPLLVRTRVPLTGGDVIVELLDADERALVTVFVAATANRRGTTSLAWRGFAHGHAGDAPLGWRLRRLAGSTPFAINHMIDGRAVAALEIAPSRDRRRGPEIGTPITPVAPAATDAAPSAQERSLA